MIKLIGGAEGAAGTGEIAAPTSTGAASNVDRGRMIRVYNSGGSDYLVSVQTGAGTPVLIGTFTLRAYTVEYVQKDATDEIFAAHAAIKLANVSVVG